jgi:hypothetical protein
MFLDHVAPRNIRTYVPWGIEEHNRAYVPRGTPRNITPYVPQETEEHNQRT